MILYYLFSIICNAQDHGFFQQIWQEEGLSQSSVSSIVQDPQGFIWMGTQDGLNRYDGKNVDKFNTQPFDTNSISGSIIWTICVRDNKLWVLSTEGLDLFDLNTLQAKRLSKLIKGIKSERWSIIKTWVLNNRIFLFTPDGFSELKEKEGNEYILEPYEIERRFSDYRRLTVLAAQEDDEKNLFIGTSEGIYKCNSGSFVFKPFQVGGKEKLFTDRCPVLFCKQNKLYFSQENIFYEYNIAANELYSFSAGALPDGNITCAIADNQNKIWLGTNGNGLFRIAENTKGELQTEKHFIENGQSKYGLKSNSISCLFQGSHPNEDVVWIGSTDAGAFSYSYSKNSFGLVSSVLDKPKEIFFSLVKDRDNIVWCATRTGIYRIDRSRNQYSSVDVSAFAPKNVFYVTMLYCDSDDKVWVGLYNNLFTIDKKSNTLVKVAGPLLPSEQMNNVFKIAGSGDTLLIGTGQGLVVYTKSTANIVPVCTVTVDKKVIKIPRVETLFVDSKKNWWICTGAGVVMIDNQHKMNRFYWHNPSDRNSLLANEIMDIQETREGEILMASSNGFSVLKNPYGETQFENYNTYPGLSNNYIYGMTPDKEGNFWLSTNYGISVFNPAKRKFKSYHASDGAYINEFNSYSHYAGEDGELLFGGIGGIISIYPEKLVKHFRPPDLILRAFKINQSNADSLLPHLPPSLDLNYDQNSFYLEFSVPYFSGLGSYKLFYLLEGLQDRWTEVGPSNSFSLINLAHGSYLLKVKVVNDDGLESEKPFTLSINIRPPFWKSIWFLLFIVIALFLIIWLFYQYRIQNKLMLIKEIDLVRQEENERVRKAAALDLHDEFGNGLTRISMLVETVRIKVPKENSDILRALDIITGNCSRLYQGTKDFIWSINPGNDNLYEIVIRLKDFGDELFYGTGISFEVEGLKEGFKNLNHLPGTGRNIIMIFKEALSNILKHAKADKVSLSVIESGTQISIRLNDNGKGFDPDSSKNGFGISNMQHRAGKAGVLLAIDSAGDTGSTVTVIINYSANPTPPKDNRKGCGRSSEIASEGWIPARAIPPLWGGEEGWNNNK